LLTTAFIFPSLRKKAELCRFLPYTPVFGDGPPTIAAMSLQAEAISLIAAGMMK
jgi:hypothetical protein